MAQTTIPNHASPPPCRCHFQYLFLRSDTASLLAHPISVAVAFTLLLLVSSLLLGFVPVIQTGLR